MSSTQGKVIIVGGGIIGTACAHYLTRSGWQVTIVDRGAFGQGCSHANCGLVVPSHVLPLAEPGALREALHSLFVGNAPLSIQPRLDLNLWSWLVQFALRCRRQPMIEAGHAIHALLCCSRVLYQELIDTESLDCEWQTRGLLFPYRSAQAMERYAATNQLLQSSFGCSAQRLDGETVREWEPALKPGLAGAWYYEEDAHLRPDRLLTGWRKLLEHRGVIIVEHCPVRGVRREFGKCRALLTPQGEMEANAFVLATGAFTPLLARTFRCRVPIQPGKGYSITMAQPQVCPRIPLIFPETHVAVTPLDSGYRLGSTMEFVGYDNSIQRQRLRLLRDGVIPYLREPFGKPVQEEWAGLRPMTYDGKPIIDRAPGMDNLLLAAGHNTLGLSMAPATGKLVAEMLSGDRPHIDPVPYAVTRF